MARLKTAVLISGRGSNLAALIRAAEAADYPAEIALVVSNRADAGGLALAEAAGIATAVIDHRGFAERDAFDRAVEAAIVDAGCTLICLAGFMRILGAALVERWSDRILNIHPSLLPAFPGLDTHRRALAAGVRITGATVHLARPAVDDGPIIAQAAVPVLPEDGEADLADRVLAAEHRLYPLALGLLAAGRVRVADGRVRIDGPVDWPASPLISPVPE